MTRDCALAWDRAVVQSYCVCNQNSSANTSLPWRPDSAEAPLIGFVPEIL